MRDIFTMRSVCLEPGMVTMLQLSRPLSVQVSSGLVWLTIEGRPDDYHLGSGQHLQLPAHARVVIESVRGLSRIQISAYPQDWRVRLIAVLRPLAVLTQGLRRRLQPQRQACH